MHTFTVRLVVIDEDQQSVDEAPVDAEYYTAEGDFVTFKDADHKQVASFNTRNVVSVTRAGRKPPLTLNIDTTRSTWPASGGGATF